MLVFMPIILLEVICYTESVRVMAVCNTIDPTLDPTDTIPKTVFDHLKSFHDQVLDTCMSSFTCVDWWFWSA